MTEPVESRPLLNISRAAEIFWYTSQTEWMELVEQGQLLLHKTSPDHAVVLYVAEPVKSMADLIARSSEPDLLRLLALGDPGKVNEALDRLREQARSGTLNGLAGAGELPGPSRAMLQDDTSAGLADRHKGWLGQYVGNRWIFFYAEDKLETPTHDEHIEKLGPQWRAEIERVITASNPTTSALRDIDELTWYGYVDGNLLGGAMGVERRRNSDGTLGSHFAGLGTDPDMQGRGIGGSVMAGTINRELDETDLTTFGMWSWNDKARRLYNRLGIIEGHEYITYSTTPLQES
ncbi:GNAT family N-acetyltransferase [Flaviflexus massiliensis]|uniref:GNAT family N-acetyltransferase n=1 Tax=Flaviflexus massiliensis TaxID=1522309 RepID=UPI0006D5B04A|nr:GNAT family N-acetyltransferase [Flaviflexus massiliensis]